ncbi:vomeronasal type-2 receptor 26-like [Latimeria chalumnae]|uniref:vomeronasal type-2 receptor 26-like n=1 Tax=Latimeria chalumnae TaxID=7897 RepID=UPI00313E7784
MVINIFLFWLYFTAIYGSTQPGCKLPNLELKGASKDGDLIIGGIFPVTKMTSVTEDLFMEKPKLQTCEIHKETLQVNLKVIILSSCDMIPKSSVYRDASAMDDVIPAGLCAGGASLLGTLIPAAILCTFVRYRDTPIVKANNRELSYLLLVALILCFLYCLIFIGQPLAVSCILYQTAFGIIFAFCVSCVLAKIIIVVIAFNVTKPDTNLKRWVGHKLSNIIVLTCTLLQVITWIVWLSSSSPFPECNMKSQPGKIIIECNEGSTIALWCMLGYMSLLAIVSFIVALIARNLPDSFNEAKFITFSMLLFVTVWQSFIPAYLSTKGKYMVAVEVFAILASSAGLMACIFFPQCYIILLRPDTRDYL